MLFPIILARVGKVRPDLPLGLRTLNRMATRAARLGKQLCIFLDIGST